MGEGENYAHSELSSSTIRAYYNVYNRLGFGFLEKVYEKAMVIELNEMGFRCERQRPVKVFYKDRNVGEYFADIIVENKIIIELKASEYLMEEHEAQLTNYLKATEVEIGLLLNFGKQPQLKRKAFSNKHKQEKIR